MIERADFHQEGARLGQIALFRQGVGLLLRAPTLLLVHDGCTRALVGLVLVLRAATATKRHDEEHEARGEGGVGEGSGGGLFDRRPKTRQVPEPEQPTHKQVVGRRHPGSGRCMELRHTQGAHGEKRQRGEKQ